MQLFINNWATMLTAPAGASAGTFSVPLADAEKLTGLGAGDHYLLTLAEVDGNGLETAWEIVKVTGAASGVLTVLRAQEGTAARDWASAAVISARVTKGSLEVLQESTGTAVGDAAPQPLGTASPGASAAASREDHVHAKPTAADIGAATTAQGTKADTAVQPGALASGLAGKVDKDGAKGLSDENYTSGEKAKLAGLDGSHFKGLHAGLAALQAAHPSAVAGDYADVDSGSGADVARYIWDVSDSKWVIQSGASGSMTAAQIKTAYESNPDTNGFSDAEKAKLGAIAAGATANATDAQLRDRALHTGQQAASTISDFAATVRATVLTGLSLASGAAIAAGDSALVAWGKLQKQINDLVAAVGGKQDTLVSGTNIKTVNGNTLLGSGSVSTLPVVQTFTGAKTLGLADINTYNVSQDATAQPVTLPAQVTVAWTADAELHIEQGAAGAVTITGAAGVTINGVVAPSILLFAKGAVATLKRKGLNNWTLVGAIGTAAEQRVALGLGVGDSPSFAGVSVTSGPLALVGNGRRITGEYSAGLGSLANRTVFQAATVNGQTLLTTMPNGTSQNAGFQAFASAADLENSARATFAVVGGVSVFVGSERTGSAPYLPLALSTGGLDRLTIATTGTITTPGIYASTTASAANVFVDSTGLLQRSTSSEQYKSDIEPMSIGYAKLAYELQPIWYRSKCENDSPEWSWWGFSAEQAATVDPRLVHWRTTEPVEVDGPIDEETGLHRKVIEHRLLAAPVAEGFAYERLTVHHNALLTAQRDRIEAMESTIADLLIRINALEKAV